MVCPKCGKKISGASCGKCGFSFLKEPVVVVGNNKSELQALQVELKKAKKSKESFASTRKKSDNIRFQNQKSYDIANMSLVEIADLDIKNLSETDFQIVKEKLASFRQRQEAERNKTSELKKRNVSKYDIANMSLQEIEALDIMNLSEADFHKVEEKIREYRASQAAKQLSDRSAENETRKSSAVQSENTDNNKDKGPQRIRLPIIITAVVFLIAAILVAVPKISLKRTILNNAWGPEDRATFTWEKPAGYATFNSITDNPSLGDERNFVRIGDAEYTGPHADEVEVEAWKEYELYIYYHNNASSSLGDKATAHNTRLAVMVPYKLDKGETGVAKGIITSSDADPSVVWDSTYMHASEAVEMYYVENSAILHSFGETEGEVLDAKLLFGKNDLPVGSADGTEYKKYVGGDADKEVLSRGAPISPNKDIPGEIPASEEGSRGYITLKLKALPVDNTGNK